METAYPAAFPFEETKRLVGLLRGHEQPLPRIGKDVWLVQGYAEGVTFGEPAAPLVGAGLVDLTELGALTDYKLADEIEAVMPAPDGTVEKLGAFPFGPLLIALAVRVLERWLAA